MNEVKFETSLYSPVFRKLVNESLTIFVDLQTLEKDGDERIPTAQLVRISRQYRSVLRDCQEQLDQERDVEMATDEATSFGDQSELLYKLELIWHLIEVIYVDKSSGVILPALLQWIALHFPECDRLASSVLAEDDLPESTFWDAITLYLLQGRTEEASRLLRIHPEMSTDPFVSLDELIRKLPKARPEQSGADFLFAWRHWQTEVVARIDEGEFGACMSAYQVARLLAGDEQAFVSVQDKCETWYEFMVGKLLYTNPSLKSFDLSRPAEAAVAAFGGLSSMTTLDSVILSALEMDLPQVMHELVSTLDNFWFPAHLLDLLHHCGRQGMDSGPSEEGMREYLILDYATCLMSHNSLWQVGVLYFDHCPTQGRQRLELLLERVSLRSDRRAEKVLAIAKDHGMTTLEASTCKVMGMKALRKDNLGKAMSWALRSQDVAFTSLLADRLLLRYCESGSFSAGDLLDHLGVNMVLSDRLAFLAKYREFHGLVSAGDFKAASALLHSLLWSRLAPKYFWVTLLVDTIPFLATEEVYFGSEHTYELLHCLQELCSDLEVLPKKQRIVLEDHEKHVRMKLSKNLAMALMAEGDSNV